MHFGLLYSQISFQKKEYYYHFLIAKLIDVDVFELEKINSDRGAIIPVFHSA